MYLASRGDSSQNALIIRKMYAIIPGQCLSVGDNCSELMLVGSKRDIL